MRCMRWKGVDPSDDACPKKRCSTMSRACSRARLQRRGSSVNGTNPRVVRAALRSRRSARASPGRSWAIGSLAIITVSGIDVSSPDIKNSSASTLGLSPPPHPFGKRSSPSARSLTLGLVVIQDAFYGVLHRDHVARVERAVDVGLQGFEMRPRLQVEVAAHQV